MGLLSNSAVLDHIVTTRLPTVAKKLQLLDFDWLCLTPEWLVLCMHFYYFHVTRDRKQTTTRVYFPTLLAASTPKHLRARTLSIRTHTHVHMRARTYTHKCVMFGSTYTLPLQVRSPFLRRNRRTLDSGACVGCATLVAG